MKHGRPEKDEWIEHAYGDYGTASVEMAVDWEAGWRREHAHRTWNAFVACLVAAAQWQHGFWAAYDVRVSALEDKTRREHAHRVWQAMAACIAFCSIGYDLYDDGFAYGRRIGKIRALCGQG